MQNFEAGILMTFPRQTETGLVKGDNIENRDLFGQIAGTASRQALFPLTFFPVVQNLSGKGGRVLFKHLDGMAVFFVQFPKVPIDSFTNLGRGQYFQLGKEYIDRLGRFVFNDRFDLAQDVRRNHRPRSPARLRSGGASGWRIPAFGDQPGPRDGLPSLPINVPTMPNENHFDNQFGLFYPENQSIVPNPESIDRFRVHKLFDSCRKRISAQHRYLVQ